MMASVPPTETPREDEASPEGQAPPEGQIPREDQAPPEGSPRVPARPDPGPVLPERSSDETDAAWGERPEPDDDEWFRQERPPHHDR
jgi:hypothetical protein